MLPMMVRSIIVYIVVVLLLHRAIQKRGREGGFRVATVVHSLLRKNVLFGLRSTETQLFANCAELRV
uniref:Putative secreted protein n=1 Tax=Anopheles darlingi TaxID=43151 RepID=A0A2M4D0U3_ANODA